MKSRVGLLVTGLLVTATASAQGESLYVPDDYPTVTAAVDNAVAGDTVWVSPGTYYHEALRIADGVAVVSVTGDRSTTRVSGQEGMSTVEFLPGEATTAFRGFTVNNGYQYDPPVIIGHNPNMVVEDCRVFGAGPVDWYDPGIVLYNGGTFRNCEISNGHEAHMFWLVNPNAQLLVEDCVLHRNFYPFGMDGFQSGASLLFRNCTFFGSHLDPGIYSPDHWATDFSLEFENCIFYNAYYIGFQGSEPPTMPEVYEFRYTCRFEGKEWVPESAEGPGNFYVDPLICEDPNWLEDPPYEAWLESESPCIGTGLGGENVGARYGICGVTGVEDGPVRALASERLRAWPNPANDRVVIELRSEVPVGSEFEVVDALGRRVASIPGPSSAGISVLEWDTRDATGRAVPSGAYFVRSAEPTGAGGRSPGHRVVIVR